jgi:hypothetical protein
MNQLVPFRAGSASPALILRLLAARGFAIAGIAADAANGRLQRKKNDRRTGIKAIAIVHCHAYRRRAAAAREVTSPLHPSDIDCWFRSMLRGGA